MFLATFILGCGLILLCVNGLPILSEIISFGYSCLLEVFIRIIESIQGLPYNNIDGVYISQRSVVLLYILIGTLMYLISIKPRGYKDVFYKKRKRRRISKLILASCISLLMVNSIFHSYRIQRLEELIVYDISQGTVLDIFGGGYRYTLKSKNVDR